MLLTQSELISIHGRSFFTTGVVALRCRREESTQHKFENICYFHGFRIAGMENRKTRAKKKNRKEREVGHSSGAVCSGKGSKVELLLLHNEGNRWRPVQGTFLRNTILSVSFERSTETLHINVCVCLKPHTRKSLQSEKVIVS